MKKIKKQNGSVAILLVTVVTLSLTLAVMLLYVLVNARIEALHGYRDRFMAYYLCETGISVATLDFANGKVGEGKDQWTKRDFDYKIGEKVYTIHYEITKPNGSINYKIMARVRSPFGLDRTYYLTASGPLTFPIFIRGFAGGR